MVSKLRLCAPLAALLAWPGVSMAAELQVVVAPVAHDKGAVKVVLYASPETFRKEDKALAVQSQPARPGEMAFTFDGLAEGRYAVVAYHDENGNGQLDRFLGMIPTEGWGLSNNPEVSGPPQFEPSAFTVSETQPARIAIGLRY
ncbi:MAG: DUF2141 domain-containing protein [Bacteroidales bacterium]